MARKSRGTEIRVAVVEITWYESEHDAAMEYLEKLGRQIRRDDVVVLHYRGSSHDDPNESWQL